MKLNLPKELTRTAIYFWLALIGTCAGVWGILCNNTENTIIAVPAILIGLLSILHLVFVILIKPLISLSVDWNFPIKDILQIVFVAPIAWFTIQYISQEKQQMEMFDGYVKDMTTLLMSETKEKESRDVYDEILRAQTRVAWQAFDRRRRVYLLLLVSKTPSSFSSTQGKSSSRIRNVQLLRNLDKSNLDLSCPSVVFEFYFYPSFQIQSANAACKGLKTGNFDEVYLPDVNLSGADLSDSRFKESALMRATLSNATLNNSNFQKANLTEANLEYANLNGSSTLSDALLSEANLKGTQLEGADLNGARLIGADLSDAKLKCASLRYADLRGTILEGADLRGVDLTGADLRGAIVNDETSLDPKWAKAFTIINTPAIINTLASNKNEPAECPNSKPGQRVEPDRGVDLSGVNLRGVDLSKTKVSLADADFSGADLSGADLSNLDLSNAKLDNANLKNSKLDSTKLPSKWEDIHKIVNHKSKNKDELQDLINKRKSDLMNANLSKTDMSRLDLSEAKLNGKKRNEHYDTFWSDLNGADLSGATLREANLRWTNLGRADLSNANLNGAQLQGANLEDAKMTGANLLNVEVDQLTRFDEDNKWKAAYTIVNYRNLPAKISESYKRDTIVYLDSSTCDLSYKDVSKDTQKIFRDNLKIIRNSSCKTHTKIPS